MYCQNCGTELDSEAKFCDQCGTDVATRQQAVSQENDRSATEQAASGEYQSETHQGTVEQPTRQQSHGTESAPIASKEAYTQGQLVSLGGAVLTILGAFLPWLTADLLTAELTVTGIDADGIFTLVFAVLVTGMIVYTRGNWRKALVGVAILGLLTALLGIAYINDPWLGVENPPPEAAQSLVTVGIGLYLTAAGGLAMLAGPILDTVSG
jgi:hypothetical protein